MASVATESQILEVHSTVAKGEIDYARWFISLRWIAVAVAATMSFVAVYVVEFLPHESWLPLIGVVIVLAALNVLYTHLVRTGKRTSVIVAFQAYTDLVLLTILIHFSGGIENPLILLMIFHVIIAGITLSRKQCYSVAVAATALFALLAWSEAFGLIEHYTLQLVPHYEQEGHVTHTALDMRFVSSYVGLQGAFLLLTAFFVTALSERLRQKEHQLEILADRAQTQHQLLERALETTGTGLFVCDHEMQPVLANRRWNTWSELFSKNSDLQEKFGGDDSPIRRTLDHGKVFISEIVSPHITTESSPTATLQTFQVTTAPILDKDGITTHVVQLVQDITDQKTAQTQMIRAGQLAAVGELAGQVAHEVNNPIAIISTKGRLLLSDHKNEMSDRTADEIRKMIVLADRVADIARGLLSYCRPSGAKRSRVDIGGAIRRSLALVEQRAEDLGIEIEDRIPESIPPVYANDQEIEQVFLNLFLNSLDAMSNGGTIQLSASVPDELSSSDAKFVSVKVADTGIGMSEEVRKRIFEPFFTTKPEGKGTGLGLSICHGLIQHNDGSIEVESIVGEGSQITIKLPIHR
ncbi:MAG: ATP-binding protein, partial [Bacteroidetes bacterium]|nr:ATP-binding protein [Bacteroidota bacterium]